jgi:prepilin-type N-terminal cleavage/methylation domain-containing protein
MNGRRGFTLVELLVVIGIITLLVGIIVPSLARARELAKREACRSTLDGLGQAVHSYATAYDNFLPAFEDGSNSSDTVGLNRTQESPGDSRSNTRGWWLMVREGFVERGQFFCASDQDVDNQKRQTDDLWDFPTMGGKTPLSYSLQRTKIGPSGGTRTTRADSSALVIAADHNGLYKWKTLSNNKATVTRDGSVPLDTDEKKAANSENHGRAGQNCLRLDGSVQWAETPLAGADEDCIWTQDDGSTMGDATLSGKPEVDRGKLKDSLLVP